MEGSLGNVDGTDGSAWREALIEELVNPRPWFGRPVAESREELTSKDDQELRRLGASTRAERARGQPLHMVIEESIEFYESRYAVDFAIWIRKKLWSIDEAAALLCSLNPDMVKLKNINELARNSRLGNYFMNLFDLMDRAREAEKLPHRVEPVWFLDWAKLNDVVVPSALTSLKETGDAARIMAQELAASQARVRDLEVELQTARVEADQLKNDLKKENISDSRLTTLQKVVYVWVKGYYPEYCPGRKGTTTIASLQRKCEMQGVHIDDEPLREIVKSAFRKINKLKSDEFI